MAKLVENGADATDGNGIELRTLPIERTLYTVQSTETIATGISFAIQGRVRGSSVWTNIPNGVLDISTDLININIGLSTSIRIDPNDLDSSFTGDIVIG